MTPPVRLSVILPVYNARPFLSQCLESVLTQGGVEFEIIMVDDGSSDGSSEICDQYARSDSRIRLFRTENRGVAAAKNLALREARGEFMTLVDADDYLEPDALRTLVAGIEKHGRDFLRAENTISIDARYPPPAHMTINVAGPPQGKMPPEDFVDIALVGGRPRVRYWSPGGGAIVRMSVIRTNSLGFNEALRLGEDSCFMLDLAEAGARYGYISERVYVWRRHGYNSLTLTALNPLERTGCKFYFYRRLRGFMEKRFGAEMSARALANNVASAWVEMLLAYGGWLRSGNFLRMGRMFRDIAEDGEFQSVLLFHRPGKRWERLLLWLMQHRCGRLAAVVARMAGGRGTVGWSDWTDLDFHKVTQFQYTARVLISGKS